MARVHWLICGRFGGKPTLPGGYSKIGGAKTVRTRFPHHRRLGAHVWSGVTRVLQVPPPLKACRLHHRHSRVTLSTASGIDISLVLLQEPATCPYTITVMLVHAFTRKHFDCVIVLLSVTFYLNRR
jgi:hypothetical protein